MHLVKLSLGEELDCPKIEDLLFDDPFLEKLCGVYELVGHLVDGEGWLVCSVLFGAALWLNPLSFDVGQHLVNKEVEGIGLESRHAEVLAVLEPWRCLFKGDALRRLFPLSIELVVNVVQTQV